ncbi:MAG: SH3 domain-containing protein [Enhydrobacter sp.]|nr:MAG: SH3 domain-containing protein [Enhydrobacter sp.]
MAHTFNCCRNLLLALLLLVSPPALAQQMVSVPGKELNMRSGPGTQHPVEWVLSRGYPLQVVGRQGRWLKVVDFEKDTGWVYEPLTDRTPYHIVTVKTANLRSEASTASKILARLIYGDVLRTLTRDKDWVRVQHNNGTKGWVARRLLWGW